MRQGSHTSAPDIQDSENLVSRLVERRASQGLDTIIDSPGEGDVDRIFELASHVGHVSTGFEAVVRGIACGRDPGRGGYSHRLAVIRSSGDGPCEGYNLMRVRDRHYERDPQGKVAASLSTSFGGSSGGASIVLLKSQLDSLGDQGFQKFWSRPNQEMAGVLERLGFAEAGLPDEFMEAEKTGSHNIWARNMTPYEVAYDYFRGDFIGNCGYSVIHPVQVKIDGVARTLEDWMALHKIRVSAPEASGFLRRIAPEGMRLRPLDNSDSGSRQIISASSTPAYIDAIAQGRETEIKWHIRDEADLAQPIQCQPAADLSHCCAYYLARGDRFREQIIDDWDVGGRQFLPVYRFVQESVFNGVEFGSPKSIQALKGKTGV